MRTIRTKVYKFDELSEQAKQTAIEKIRDKYTYEYDYPWQEEGIESLKEFCHQLDLELYAWEYSTDAWADVRDSKIEDSILALSGNRLRTYLVNNYDYLLHKRKVYESKSKKRVSRIKWIETDCPLTGYCFDCDILNVLMGFIKKPDNKDFQDLIRDCVGAWSRAVRSECEYFGSDDYVREEIQANELEFMKGGTPYTLQGL